MTFFNIHSRFQAPPPFFFHQNDREGCRIHVDHLDGTGLFLFGFGGW